MPQKKKTPPKKTTEAEPLLATASAPSSPAPDFMGLLRHPLVDLPLPRDFSEPDEAEHLDSLWMASQELQAYRFDRFVHAGGSGMVFKVYSIGGATAPLALKIARRKLYSAKPPNPNVAGSLSPLSPQELRALSRLSHSNIVRLHDTILDKNGVFAIVTSFVNNPAPLDQFLRDTLSKDPSRKRGVHAFSPQRLDAACIFLFERFQEIVDAIAHMHEQNLFHCDLKPANILVESLPRNDVNHLTSRHAILTDLGSCVHPEDADKDGHIKIHFTWTYAHPN